VLLAEKEEPAPASKSSAAVKSRRPAVRGRKIVITTGRLPGRGRDPGSQPVTLPAAPRTSSRCGRRRRRRQQDSSNDVAHGDDDDDDDVWEVDAARKSPQPSCAAERGATSSGAEHPTERDVTQDEMNSG